MQRDVDEGRIGEVRFLDASARSNLVNQGTHILEMMFAFNGNAAATSVFGGVSGAQTIDSKNTAPDMAEAVITFENGVCGLVQSGENAPFVDEEMAGQYHKRISVHGTRGFIQWQMYAWECSTPKGYKRGEKDYREEDLLAQVGLTEATYDWLADENCPHPTRLELALQQFNVILGLYASALENRPIQLPYQPEGSLIERLKGVLKEG